MKRQPFPSAWLPFARITWITLALLVAALWAWDTFFLNPVTPETSLFSLGMPLGYFLIAFVLFWRKSDDPVALLVSLMLVFLGPYLLSGVTDDLALHPAGRFFNSVLGPLGVMTTILFFYLFPDGTFVPRWTGAVAMLAVVVMVAAGLFAPWLGATVQMDALVFPLSVLVGLFAQVYRFTRVSTPAQRQQTKWVVAGLLGPVAAFFWYLLLIVPGYLDLSNPTAVFANSLFVAPASLLLPLSIMVAVMRYRLWDIDVLIRRTLVYALLTALLALVYFGGVVLLQGLFQRGVGEGSQLEVVIATLAIAALFNPLRHRVQEFIDRRFYRRRYDAQKTLQKFSEVVRDRDNADIPTLSGELLGVIQETVQPAHVSLWLTNGSDQ